MLPSWGTCWTNRLQTHSVQQQRLVLSQRVCELLKEEASHFRPQSAITGVWYAMYAMMIMRSILLLSQQIHNDMALTFKLNFLNACLFMRQSVLNGATVCSTNNSLFTECFWCP